MVELMSNNNNPMGRGGFQPGQVGNPGGRPKSHSRVQLWFLKHALEAGGIIVAIARDPNATKSDAVRLAACREILDRGIGRAPQSVDLAIDLTVGKRLDEMSADELLEFKRKYLALTTAAPAVIDQVLEEDAPQTELDLGGSDNGGRGDGSTG
jgi:hypothetical protein